MAQGTCSVESCEKPVKCRGWCSAHYRRWQRNGDPGPAGDARLRPWTACSVDGCERKAVQRGYCSNHYQLWRRNGKPERVRDWGVYRSILVTGYVRVWCPGHPEAAKYGYALEHRKVWFDAHGPIPRGFQIHHVNSDRTDNRLENLELKSASDHARDHAQENGYIRNQFGTWPLKDRR